MRRDNHNSWNPGVARMCGHFRVSKYSSNIEKYMKWHHFQQCRWKVRILPPLGQWRNKHYFTRVCAWIHHNNEIICSKPWCTWIHVSRSLNIHWTYSLNAVHFLPWVVVTPDLWNTNVEPYRNKWLPESILHALFGTEHITDTLTGNILKPHQYTHSVT
jgi:hypothetical protein